VLDQYIPDEYERRAPKNPKVLRVRVG